MAPDHPAPDDPDAAPSLFHLLMVETLPTLEIGLGDRVVVVDHPSADAVCELDTLAHGVTVRGLWDWLDDVAPDVLDALLGDSEDIDAAPALAGLLASVRAVRSHFALVDLPPGMWTAVVEQVDLYGEAIETDLSDRGQDLLDWMRGRRPWPQLLRLIQRLPPESHYKASLLDDEDLAHEQIAAEDAGTAAPPRQRPPLVGESYERTLLRSIASSLPRIEHAVYAVNAPKGKGGKPPNALPGPEAATERVRDRMANADVDDLIAQVTPEHARTAPSGFRERASGLLAPD